MTFGKMQNQMVSVIVVWFKGAFFIPNSTKKHTSRIDYRDNKNTYSSQSHKRLIRKKI